MAERKGLVIFSPYNLGEGIRRALEIGRGEVIDMVRNSQIRGRGGAGFPTGVKWNLAATAVAEKKYVVCNADEGEPGTFKDRVLLEEYANLVFEGMIIAAFAIKAEQGFLYLRGEYRSLVDKLERQLVSLRKKGWLGKNIFGKQGINFDIEIRLGVGAYVCGEETALIESLEGYRGEPRNRPPFPVNTGYNGYPTVVNNVETFAAIPHIISKGVEWFCSIGTEKSSGTKLLSISGDCAYPGVYEVEFGSSLKEIMKMVKAKDPKAAQVGGASGICVPAKDFNRKIAYEDLPTGGSLIIFGRKRNMLEVAENFLEFFQEESCGQCTPCREGVPVLLEYVRKMKKEGKLPKNEEEDLYSLSETMQLASKCGLGQSAPNALLSILKNFSKEIKPKKGAR